MLVVRAHLIRLWDGVSAMPAFHPPELLRIPDLEHITNSHIDTIVDFIEQILIQQSLCIAFIQALDISAGYALCPIKSIVNRHIVLPCEQALHVKSKMPFQRVNDTRQESVQTTANAKLISHLPFLVSMIRDLESYRLAVCLTHRS